MARLEYFATRANVIGLSSRIGLASSNPKPSFVLLEGYLNAEINQPSASSFLQLSLHLLFPLFVRLLVVHTGGHKMEQTTKSHASHHLLAPRQKLEHPLHHTPPSTSAVFGVLVWCTLLIRGLFVLARRGKSFYISVGLIVNISFLLFTTTCNTYNNIVSCPIIIIISQRKLVACCTQSEKNSHVQAIVIILTSVE